MSNDYSKYSGFFNYFNFMKNLKNTPDNGRSPLQEWQDVIDFFSKVYVYIDIEWAINLDEVLTYTSGSYNEDAVVSQHRQVISQIIVRRFKIGSSVSNAAGEVIDYLKDQKLIVP